MAKNIIRRPPEKPTRSTSPSKQLSLSFGWFMSQRSKLIWGAALLLLSVGLLLAFVSYLFTGEADQSVVGAVIKVHIRQSGSEIQNWLGVSGAVVAHFFIFRLFGISALLIVPVLFVAGYKIMRNIELIPLQKLTIQCLFYLFWLSTFLGFVVLKSQTENSLGWLCGGIGYELNLLLTIFSGIGSFFIIFFSLFLFVVYHYNIRSFEEVVEKLGHSAENEVVGEDKPPITPIRASKSVAEMSEDEQEAYMKKRLGDSLVNATQTLENLPIDKNRVDKKPFKPEVAFVVEQTDTTSQADDKPALSENEEDTVHEQILKEFGLYDPTLDLPKYRFPTINLLKEYDADKVKVPAEELNANKDKIVETLGNYGIGIAEIKATVGPTVTLYEIIPDAGVRISKIKNLEDDIALSLAALGIRIIAPIPGKGTIGIEVPNKKREMVSIRSVIASEKFQSSTFDLPIIVGKTISNEIFITDLAKMPHLLMAGATGQGKSVGLNVILASLIYKKHPAQLKFVLVDPKKVELTLFNKIERHFLAKLPNVEEAIITDTKKVVHTLNSLCLEMDMRYNLLKDAGCRNLKEYNVKFIQRRLNPEKGHKFMPYIVLVIDELADLMMTAGKEVETPIARLAQLARAIGIHLVVATQRPSVNVITGTIKANFPARLSFKVTSKIDSRTILDAGGAEQLVGMGDMLLSQGSDIIRLQCPFVDTPEVDDVCEFIGNQQGYDSAYILPEFEGDDSGNEKGSFDASDIDPLFEEAARLIVTHQQGSTSLIQRRMKLGYNRAGRLMDQLEHFGIVGLNEGSKAREVLVKTDEELAILLKEIR